MKEWGAAGSAFQSSVERRSCRVTRGTEGKESSKSSVRFPLLFGGQRREREANAGCAVFGKRPVVHVAPVMKPKLEPKGQSDNKNQIESELKRTRRELENTKNALKHQVARCRHLVSAFSKKLAEKDAELKICKETREKQLNAVIRALLVLEARLRREQKSIRSMLAERDEVIRSQIEKIARLEELEDPSLVSKLAEKEALIMSQQAEIAALKEAGLESSLLDEKDALIKSQQEQLEKLSLSAQSEEIERIKQLLSDKEEIINKQKEEISRLRFSGTEKIPEGGEMENLLAERDAMIKSQQAEIDRLQSIVVDDQSEKDQKLTKIEITDEESPNMECYAKPDLISSLCIDGHDEKESAESSTETACQPDSLSSDAASTRACLGDNDTDSLCNCTITPPVVRGGLSIHDRSAFSPVPRSSHKYDESHNSSLFNNSVPDISKSEYGRFDSSLSVSQSNQDNSYYSHGSRPSPSSRDSRNISMRSFDINYQDNPVLQCVNQILLKDPDDILEDQRSNKLPSIESPFVEVDDADQPFWLSNNPEDSKLDESTSIVNDCPKPAIATSSPLEKFSIHENESLASRGNHRLSLSKLIELHNAARKLFPSRREHDGRKSVSMNDLSSALSVPRPNPPVPPKPRKSGGKKVEFDDRVESRSVDNSFQNPKTLLPPQPVYIDRTKLDIISKPSPLPFAPTPTVEPGEANDDNELYVISNSALDDEILQKLKGKNLKSFEIKLHRLAGEAMMQQQMRRQHGPDGKPIVNGKPPLNKAMLTNINLLEAAAMLRQLREAGQRKSSDGKQANVSPSMSQKARLRMAASVAQLLAQAQQQAREQQLRAQMEEQQEQAESIEVIEAASPTSSREASTGGESPGTEESEQPEPSPTPEKGDPSLAEKSPGTYDNFLEATGLSQKSIMTPSRMLNNHRSVVKPKDVKLRNKVRNAAIFERTIPPQVVGPTIKYWTEPYL